MVAVREDLLRRERQQERQQERQCDEAESLAAAMPRALIAEGRAQRLALDWVARESRARAEGRPPHPRYPLSPKLAEGLFEARRARRLVRGIEGIEAALERQQSGLEQANAARPPADTRRISRLLIVSADGSPRFYRAVDRLLERFGSRLAGVLLECDEAELGAAAFGEGRRARALMLEHKEAVVRFLTLLDELGPE